MFTEVTTVTKLLHIVSIIISMHEMHCTSYKIHFTVSHPGRSLWQSFGHPTRLLRRDVELQATEALQRQPGAEWDAGSPQTPAVSPSLHGPWCCVTARSKPWGELWTPSSPLLCGCECDKEKMLPLRWHLPGWVSRHWQLSSPWTLRDYKVPV